MLYATSLPPPDSGIKLVQVKASQSHYFLQDVEELAINVSTDRSKLHKFFWSLGTDRSQGKVRCLVSPTPLLSSTLFVGFDRLLIPSPSLVQVSSSFFLCWLASVIDEPSRQFSLHLFGLVTLSSFLRAD